MNKLPFLCLLNFEELLCWPSHMRLLSCMWQNPTYMFSKGKTPANSHFCKVLPISCWFCNGNEFLSLLITFPKESIKVKNYQISKYVKQVWQEWMDIVQPTFWEIWNHQMWVFSTNLLILRNVFWKRDKSLRHKISVVLLA